MVPKSFVYTDANVCNVALVHSAFVFDAYSKSRLVLYFFDHENTRYPIGVAKTPLAALS